MCILFLIQYFRKDGRLIKFFSLQVEMTEPDAEAAGEEAGQAEAAPAEDAPAGEDVA